LAFGFIRSRLTSWPLVRKRTIPTDRWNLVPTFADRGVSRGQRGGTPMVVNAIFLDRSRYFFFQVASHLSSQVWVDLVPDPLPLRKSGSAWNRAQDLWVCSQELWPLHHRGGQITTILITMTGNKLTLAAARILLWTSFCLMSVDLLLGSLSFLVSISVSFCQLTTGSHGVRTHFYIDFPL
jgi:hypothetical protein